MIGSELMNLRTLLERGISGFESSDVIATERMCKQL